MNNFIRNNFLAICVTLSVCYAFAKGATIYQQVPKNATSDNNATLITPLDNQFKHYWYTGKGELSSYDLQKDRYGQINDGEAVLIFVTEDFRTDKQVKLESDNKNKSTSVMKLNFVEKFSTGIYDYSVMTSVFNPIDTKAFPHAIKVSTSVQEWCGMTYMQLNQRDNLFKIEGKSYFENEVQEDIELEKTILEDELWTKIRLEPKGLPLGEIAIIPSFTYCRLRHKKPAILQANTTLENYTGTDFIGKNVQIYAVDYPEQKRKLSIYFEANFPYKIVGWTETNITNGKSLTTKATLKKSIMTNYWTKHNVEDLPLRDSLGLKR